MTKDILDTSIQATIGSFCKQYEELVNLKSDIIHISDDTKTLNETTNGFSSKLIEHDNHISSLTTYFEELLDKMSVSNRVSNKIDVARLENEKKISNKILDIQAENIKTSLPLKWNYPLSYQSNLFLMISHTPTNWNFRFSKQLKSTNMHHSSPNTFPTWPYKVKLYFNLRNGGMP